MTRPNRPMDMEALAREVQEWDSGQRSPKGLPEDPDAAPRAGAAQPVSLRLPKAMLAILKEFAAREGIGYQVLIKQWLDDRLRLERRRLEHTVPLSGVRVLRMAASFDVSGTIEHVRQGPA